MKSQSQVKRTMSAVSKKSMTVYMRGVSAEGVEGCNIGDVISQEKELGLKSSLVELEHLRTLNCECERERGVTTSV